MTNLFVIVVAYGCPVQMIAAAFGLGEQTVKDWFMRSGQRCQQAHEYFMEKTVLDLEQV